MATLLHMLVTCAESSPLFHPSLQAMIHIDIHVCIYVYDDPPPESLHGHCRVKHCWQLISWTSVTTSYMCRLILKMGYLDILIIVKLFFFLLSHRSYMMIVPQ